MQVANFCQVISSGKEKSESVKNALKVASTIFALFAIFLWKGENTIYYTLKEINYFCDDFPWSLRMNHFAEKLTCLQLIKVWQMKWNDHKNSSKSFTNRRNGMLYWVAMQTIDKDK